MPGSILKIAAAFAIAVIAALSAPTVSRAADNVIAPVVKVHGGYYHRHGYHRPYKRRYYGYHHAPRYYYGRGHRRYRGYHKYRGYKRGPIRRFFRRKLRRAYRHW